MIKNTIDIWQWTEPGLPSGLGVVRQCWSPAVTGRGLAPRARHERRIVVEDHYCSSRSRRYVMYGVPLVFFLFHAPFKLWDGTICQIFVVPFLFSCWNLGDSFQLPLHDPLAVDPKQRPETTEALRSTQQICRTWRSPVRLLEDIWPHCSSRHFGGTQRWFEGWPNQETNTDNIQT